VTRRIETCEVFDGSSAYHVAWAQQQKRCHLTKRVVCWVASLPCGWLLSYSSSDIFTYITFIYYGNQRYFEPRGNARAFVLVT
jgi:hypothetical protein